MKAAQKTLTQIAMTLALVSLASGTAVAQVGLTSGMSRVTLVARSVPQGSIRGVEQMRQTAVRGQMMEASATVRWSANAAYQVRVGGVANGSRIWVQDVNGQYQELTAGKKITVAKGTHTAAEAASEVHYRIDGATGQSDVSAPLYYEIAIDPVI